MPGGGLRPDTLFLGVFESVFRRPAACKRVPPGAGCLGGFHRRRPAYGLSTGRYNSIFLDVFGQTVPRFDKAGRGGFMRRFLTLVFLLCLAIPAGISISGCTRNPAANYCNGLGYGLKIRTWPRSRSSRRPPASRWPLARPSRRSTQAINCKASRPVAEPVHLRHHQQPDRGHLAHRQHLRRHLEPEHRRRHRRLHHLQLAESAAHHQRPALCASLISPLRPDSVTSNPVEVFVHAQVTSVSLVGPAAMPLAGAQAQLDCAGLLQRQRPAVPAVRAVFGHHRFHPNLPARCPWPA